MFLNNNNNKKKRSCRLIWPLMKVTYVLLHVTLGEFDEHVLVLIKFKGKFFIKTFHHPALVGVLSHFLRLWLSHFKNDLIL